MPMPSPKRDVDRVGGVGWKETVVLTRYNRNCLTTSNFAKIYDHVATSSGHSPGPVARFRLPGLCVNTPVGSVLCEITWSKEVKKLSDKSWGKIKPEEHCVLRQTLTEKRSTADVPGPGSQAHRVVPSEAATTLTSTPQCANPQLTEAE